MKRAIIFILGLIIVFVVINIVHYAIRPRPFRWYPSYLTYDRQPYGCSVLYDQLESFYPDKDIRRVQNEDLSQYHAFLWMKKDSLENGKSDFIFDSSRFKNFNFIGINAIFALDSLSTESLLMHLRLGNQAMIASNVLDDSLEAVLGIKTRFIDEDSVGEDIMSSKYTMELTKRNGFITYKPYTDLGVITAYPQNAEVVLRNSSGDVLGVKIPIGKGSLTYISVPILFTNYYLLKQDHWITESLLTDLPIENTYITNYYVGDPSYSPSRSILDFIHSQPSLSWAFYTAIVTLLVYGLTQIKRIERPVPLLKPPVNTTVKFLESLSSFYYIKQGNKALLIHKMNYFMEQAREIYHVNTSLPDESFYHQLAQKAKVKRSLVKLIIEKYREYISQEVVTMEQFLRFHKLIQLFKKKS